jgi:hypothetical protein
MEKSRYSSSSSLMKEFKVHIRRLGGSENGVNDFLPLPEFDQLFLGSQAVG